jgi:hypothetical protein
MPAVIHQISSFAAPTPDDVAAFASLSAEEQRDTLIAELQRSRDGDTAPLTPALSKAMFARAMARVADRYEAD